MPASPGDVTKRAVPPVGRSCRVRYRREQREGGPDVRPVGYDEDLIVAWPGHRRECGAEPGGKVGAVPPPGNRAA